MQATNSQSSPDNFENQNRVKVTRDLVETNLNMKSVENITGKSSHVVVYGFENCYYTEVQYTIRKIVSLKPLDWKVQKVTNFAYVGSPDVNFLTLEGKKIEKLNISPSEVAICKAGISNVALESLKRLRQGMEPFTLLFCIEREGHYPFNAENIASNSEGGKFTYSELRRVVKLFEFENSPHEELRELSIAAKKTIKFVKLIEKNGEVHLEEVDPHLEKLSAPWKERKEIKIKKLNQEAEDLKQLATNLTIEAENIGITPLATVKEKAKALDAAFLAQNKARKAAKKAQAYFESFKNGIPLVDDGKEISWRNQSLAIIKKFNQDNPQ